MKTALLALLLSTEPVRFIASQPPPERVAQVVWAFQDQEVSGVFLTDYQAKLAAARMEACEERLAEAQIEAAAVSMPRWAYILVGAAAGLTIGWFTTGVVR